MEGVGSSSCCCCCGSSSALEVSIGSSSISSLYKGEKINDVLLRAVNSKDRVGWIGWLVILLVYARQCQGVTQLHRCSYCKNTLTWWTAAKAEMSACLTCRSCILCHAAVIHRQQGHDTAIEGICKCPSCSASPGFAISRDIKRQAVTFGPVQL